MILTEKDQERFWAKVDKTNKAHCWLWTARLQSNGYGHFRLKDRAYGAHVISYLIHNVDFELKKDNLYVLHKCDIRCCVNPYHLFLGSPKDNMQDMVAKGRSLIGSKHHKTNLTEAKVLLIKKRLANNERGADLAKLFNVSKNVICQIKKRKTWTHLCHICETQKCQNPAHLFLGFPGNCKGSNHGGAKLKEEDIPIIRKMLIEGKQQKEIALTFNVCRIAITDIKSGKTWKHVI